MSYSEICDFTFVNLEDLRLITKNLKKNKADGEEIPLKLLN